MSDDVVMSYYTGGIADHRAIARARRMYSTCAEMRHALYILNCLSYVADTVGAHSALGIDDAPIRACDDRDYADTQHITPLLRASQYFLAISQRCACCSEVARGAAWLALNIG